MEMKFHWFSVSLSERWKKTFFFIGFGLLFILFWLVAYVGLDPDFGLHIRLGEVITQSGLPKTEPFSYTMPSWPYRDHEWLTNVWWYWMLNHVGRVGLATVYTAAALGAVFIVVPSGLWRFSLTPIILTLGLELGRFGIRPQVVSWFFLGFFIRVLLDGRWWRKIWWVIPVIMVLWTNLHGSFPLGVALVWLFTAGSVLTRRRFLLKEVGIAVLTTVATLVHPYGWQIWQEVLLQISGPQLHATINEWLPFYSKIEFSFWVLVVLSLLLGRRYLRHMPWWLLSVAGLFFLLSLSSVRHMPLFAISAIPLTALGLNKLWQEAGKIRGGKVRARFFMRLLLGIAGLIFTTEAMLAVWGWWNLSEENFYPVKAISYLKQIELDGELFAPFGWGGYLDWKFPEKKVFIDGRMPSFRWQAPPGESNNAYAEYLLVIRGENMLEIFEKYHVRNVLWHAPKLPLTLSGSLADVFKTLGLHEIQKSSSNQKHKDLITELERLGWLNIYQDEVAVIYSSPN